MLEMKEVIRQAVDAERLAEWGKEIIEKNNQIVVLSQQNKELQAKVAELLDVADNLNDEIAGLRSSRAMPEPAPSRSVKTRKK
jgi:cell division protein FtsB